MNIEDLIPKDKDDMETAELLTGYTYEEVKPIIPELLKWMQDMNWPVSHPVAAYLETFIDKLGTELLVILKGDDEMWKYWIIDQFGRLTHNADVLNEVNRIAFNPTPNEIYSEVDEVAREVLEARGQL